MPKKTFKKHSPTTSYNFILWKGGKQALLSVIAELQITNYKLL